MSGGGAPAGPCSASEKFLSNRSTLWLSSDSVLGRIWQAPSSCSALSVLERVMKPQVGARRSAARLGRLHRCDGRQPVGRHRGGWRAMEPRQTHPEEPYCISPKDRLAFVSEYLKYICSLFKRKIFHRSDGRHALEPRWTPGKTALCDGLVRNRERSS